MIKKSATPPTRVTERSLFYWIFRRHHSMQLLVLLVIVVNLFFKVFPLEMQKRIINEAISLRKVELLYLYCGLYIGAVTISGLLKYATNVLQVYIGQKILIEMRQELYRHLLQLPLQFYRKMQPGTVVSAMTAELNAIGFFLGGALAIPITSILTFVVFVWFMFNLNPLLALLSMGIYPVELFLIPYLQRKYNQLNLLRVQTTRSMANVVNESISGIHEIHGNTSYMLEENKLVIFIGKLQDLMKKLFVLKYGIKFANNFFQSLGPAVLFLVGGYLAINGQFTLGALVAFLSAYEKVYDPWKEMIEYYQSYQDAQIRYRQIMQIFDVDPPHLLLPPGRDTLKLSGSLTLANVSYTVPSGVRILEGINLEIKAGEHVALVGFSGSGKSTLALLMAQLYDPSQGRISMDDISMADMSKGDVGVNVAMIAQHPYIFSGTILDNILYGFLAVSGSGERPKCSAVLKEVRNVGLQDDVIRFGLQAVLSLEECRPFKEKFLRMRNIIHTTLRAEFEPAIEFYDVNRYLYHSTIRDNIVFGDSLDHAFAVENLPDNHRFLDLLREIQLERPLLTLGFAIATHTVELLQDFQDDEFFFRDNPMEMEEFTRYAQLLEDHRGPQPEDVEARKLLLILGLRFIPGKHSIVALPSAMEEKILLARKRFQRDIVHIDMKHCKEHSSCGSCAKDSRCCEGSTFVPLCPGEYLYTRTLLDNILFGAVKSEPSLDEHLRNLVAQAFREEELLDELMAIGLEFKVGSKGDRLSGGQKQKVAIARAFLKDVPLIIMDEATASLDNSSQARIQGIIDNEFKGAKTVVAVIHRLDMTRSYDRIVILKAGRVVEQGSYDELMAQKGEFYELVQAET